MLVNVHCPILLWLFTFLLFFSGDLSAENRKKEKIHIVYHIATINNWEEVVREQVETLELSGLGDACDSLTVTVVGQGIGKVDKLFYNLSFYSKVKIIFASHNLRQYEFPGIEMVQQIARNDPNAKILYFHSKGVTHFNRSTEQAARLWRRYMEYFVIEHWEDCVDALDEVDLCGVDWTISTSGLPFFAGNFWWARAQYITTCHLEKNNRFNCEGFIGTGSRPNAKTLHQSGMNPKVLKLFPYENFPHFYPDPNLPYHQGIMTLYYFEYLDEYYRE